MSKRYHAFFQTFYECPEMKSFETRQEFEDFLSQYDWGENGAEVYGLVEGVELTMTPVEKVKVWRVDIAGTK